MISPEFISDSTIAEADGIMTCDPDTADGHTLWGQDRVPNLCPPGSPAHEIKMLNVRLAADDKAGLLEMLNRIERVRGRLPQASQRLRDSLAG